VPSRWEVMLSGPAGAAIPLTAPHAVVARWLDDSDRDRGRAVPRSGHGDSVKKWACGPLRVLAPEPDGPGIAMQVRILDDTLAGRLQEVIVPGSAVRLGANHYRVLGLPRMVSRATWAGLRSWPGTRAWQVRFVTPACVRRRNRASPLLAPEALARGLADRWQQLDPATAPQVSWRGSGPVWVSDLDGHSQVQVLSRRLHRDGQPVTEDEVVSGFTGRVRYVCDHGSNDEAAVFHALLAFAGFAGAGSHTAYGFGVVAPEPTWQPPTVQMARP
jgi:CRISPR-associated endoribonuclease Cas6